MSNPDGKEPTRDIHFGPIGRIGHQHIGPNIFQISAEAEAFGFKVYTKKYFEKGNHQSRPEDFEDWKNGWSFEIESIYEKKEFRRDKVIDEIKTRLEKKHNLIIVGESGTSKSTVLKEIMCDYIDEGYIVLYNDITEIKNTETLLKFIEELLKKGNKILFAKDDAHDEKSEPVFYAMDQLSRFQENQNLRFVLSARIPDYAKFVDKTDIQSIRKFGAKSEADSDLRYELPQFNKDEIRQFIARYKPAEEDIEKLSQEISEDSKGVAIMVKFCVFGEGLLEDVRARYNRYLKDNSGDKAGKIKTMLIVSLLRLNDFEVTGELLEKMRLKKIACVLNRATLYRHYDTDATTGKQTEHWDIIHRVWSLEFFSFMFNPNVEERFDENKEYLWHAVDVVSNSKDEKATIAVVNSIVNVLIEIPPEEVELEVSSLIESSRSKLNPQTLSKLWQLIGSAWKRGSLDEYKETKALECYNKAIEIDPTDMDSWLTKGDCLSRLKRTKEALDCYNEAVKLNPHNIYSWWKIVNHFWSQNRADMAIEILDTAIKMNPNVLDLWNEKAALLITVDRSEEALKCYSEGIKMNPVPIGDNTLGSLMNSKIRLLTSLNRKEDVLECYNEAIKTNPTNSRFWRLKGDFLAKINRVDDSVKCYDKAIEIDPTDETSVIHKADFLSSLNRIDDAMKCYDKAIQNNPNDHFLLYGRASIKARRNDFQGALEDLEKAINLFNDCIEWALTDKDFEALKHNKRFLALVSK
jgi:tetratricopeptide (TPR) repeat protein